MATSVLFQHGPILIPKTASLPPARGQDFNKKLQSFHINIVSTSFVDLEDTRATELDCFKCLDRKPRGSPTSTIKNFLRNSKKNSFTLPRKNEKNFETKVVRKHR